MTEKKGFERARGALGPYEPWECPKCGGLISNGTEQTGHLWSTACVEVLKGQRADLERQLKKAQDWIYIILGAFAFLTGVALCSHLQAW